MSHISSIIRNSAVRRMGLIFGAWGVLAASAGCSSIADHEERVFVLANSARSEELSERHVGHRMIESTIAEPARLTADAVHVRQILIMHDKSVVRPEDLKRSHAEAFDLAAKVRDQIVSGADFAEVARTYSDCPMGRYKGGDIGIIRRSETVPAFEEAVFSLKEKQLSAIVETVFGFHIIERIPHV